MRVGTARRYLVACVLGALVASGGWAESLRPAEVTAPPAYAALLEKYASPQGVRYAAWHRSAEDMRAIEAVVAFFAGTQPPADRDASLAWHLNAYNAWVLHNILKKYPTEGPLDGEMLFFHGKRIVISGKKTSLHQLEQEVIRPTFKEPRVHFALNCASASCPPLAAAPFSAERLESSLDALAREFLNRNPRALRLDNGGKTVRLSKIFDWYTEDFGGHDGIVPYVNRYRDTKIPAGARVRFMDYDWSLNEATGGGAWRR